MFYERYLENLIIYGENLSCLYLACVVVSFLAVWLTWNVEPIKSPVGERSAQPIFEDNSDSSLCSTSANDRKALLRCIENTLSIDEREKESETEKQQLLSILELMKSDEKFNSVTMEELEDQLKLYRG